MSKSIYLLILFLMLFINSVNAEVSKEDPFFGIGSDFLVVKPEGNPEIFTLFDNTNIYLDSNNDGIWDYQFKGNAGQSQTLNPPWPIYSGAGIHADKPVFYKQIIYYRDATYPYRKWRYYTTIPPLNNLKSEYYFFHDVPSWPWYVVAVENATINVDENIDGTIDQTVTVGKMQTKEFKVNNFAKVYSEEGKKFFLYNQYTLASPAGTDFYTNWHSIKILATQDNTQINIDMNNDLAYDNTYTLNKGVHDFTVIKGAHVNANKPVSLFTNFEGFYFTIMPSSMLNNDLWGESNAQRYIIGLFGKDSGLYDNTTYQIDYQWQNDLISNYTGHVASNVAVNFPDMGNIHLWANMPLNYFYYYSDGYEFYFTPSYPYSRIYAATFPDKKYIGSKESLTINARVFNPFAATTASGFSVKLRFNDLFTLPTDILLVNIDKKDLNTDEVIDSTTITKNPVGGQFIIDASDTHLLNSLGPFEYYDIKYNLISPLAYGFYNFEPVEITYNAPTWEMPQ